MTPKEKAIELINKFDVKYQYELITGSFPVSMHDSVIKQCALIAVDEIINACKYNLVESYNTDWWNEVKTEIEKL